MSVMVSSLVAALLLAAVYLLGDRFLPREQKYPRRWLSMAAGASMAYVFLDVLPELGARQRAFVELVGEVSFAEHRIYALALLGFVILYGLDEMVHFTRGRADGADSEPKPGRIIFWTHIAGYALYGWVIGDILVSRGAAGLPGLSLYVAAMAFHLLVVTSALAREHGDSYSARPRVNCRSRRTTSPARKN